jgi:uncharacterized protein (DUF305 family)
MSSSVRFLSALAVFGTMLGLHAATAAAQMPDSAAVRAEPLGPAYTDADVRFMTRMIGHHAQAIVMAELAPTNGAAGSVAVLAERIISSQVDEIATMQQWLRDRGLPVPDPMAPAMPTMDGMSHEGHMAMPGMLSEAQLQELRAARGRPFERLLLTYMIQHHRGATAMVAELFASDGAAQDQVVFKFANDVNVDQITEIARMERMLAAMPCESAAP